MMYIYENEQLNTMIVTRKGNKYKYYPIVQTYNNAAIFSL